MFTPEWLKATDCLITSFARECFSVHILFGFLTIWNLLDFLSPPWHVPIRCWLGRSGWTSMGLAAARLIQSSGNPTKCWSRGPLIHYGPLASLFPSTIFYCFPHSSSFSFEPEENENPSKPPNTAWLIWLRKGEILYLNNGLFQQPVDMGHSFQFISDRACCCINLKVPKVQLSYSNRRCLSIYAPILGKDMV